METDFCAFEWGKRIHKLEAFEYFYEVSQKEFNFMISGYWLKLRAKKELTPDIMKRALHLLFRNSDNLSLCLKECDNGDLWYCRMDREDIDFEVVNGDQDLGSLLEKEICHNFNSETGPLWRVKATPSKRAPYSQEVENEERGNFVNDLIFTFHHGITDGSTNLRICGGFLQILCDVLNGCERDVYDIGKFSFGDETKRLIQERAEYLNLHPEILEHLKAEMKKLVNQQVILNEIFPVQEGTVNRTRQLVKVLNAEDNTKLIRRFKSENVSFHSGFTAVANCALMELFIENGCTREYLDITAFHALNIRRYWQDNDSAFPQGCHIGPLRLMIRTSRDAGRNFWPHAKEVHKRLRKYIEERRSLDEIIAYPLTHENGRNGFRELFQNPPPLQTYFSTTNLGDLSSMLPKTRGPVTIDWLTRTTSCHNLNIPMVHVIQTFEGKLLYGLDYSTKYVRDDVAEKYVEKIFERISHIIS